MVPVFDSDVYQVVEYTRPVAIRLPGGTMVVQHRRIFEVANKVTSTSAILTSDTEVNTLLKQIHRWNSSASKPSSADVEVYLRRYDPVSLFPIIPH